MSAPLGLAALTVLDCDPLEQISLAEDHGFDSIGVRMVQATPETPSYPLHEQPRQLDRVRRRLQDSPIEIFDVEILRLTPDFSVEQIKPFLEASESLGARAVLVAGNDPDISRTTEHYGQLAAACASHGLVASLEPMPWTQVRNVRQAVAIVEQADGDAAAGRSVLVDALHVSRSDTKWDDIKAVPDEWIHYAQLCDGPVPAPSEEEELIRQAREERLVPGEGGLDLAGIVAALPRGTPISVELPNEPQRQALGTAAWLERLVAATQHIIG